MAKTTGIAWARSTFNPWIGCTEVSPGCDACYARELDARHKWGGATHWGPGVPRHRTGASSWRDPLQWNRIAELEQQTGKVVTQSGWKGKPGFYPVFPSLCDPFDNEVPKEWHGDFWRLIRATPHLTWLLLTKRIGNVEKMHPGGDYGNVWIGASIVNQEEATRDVPKLLAVKGVAKRFISYEPAIDRVDWCAALGIWWNSTTHRWVKDAPSVDQVIVGGESSQGTHKARPFDIEWARKTVSQCRVAGVACFVKQLGSFVIGDANDFRNPGLKGDTPLIGDGHGGVLAHWKLQDRAGADPAEWPQDLLVQEFPT